MPRRAVIGSILGLLAAVVPAASAEPALRYAFKNTEHALYHIRVTMEVGDTPQITDGYVRYFPIVSDDGLGLPCRDSFRVGMPPVTGANRLAERQAHAAGTTQPATPSFIPSSYLFTDPDGNESYRFDRFGKITEESRQPSDLLPGGLGRKWEIAVPELPSDGAATWKVTHPIMLVEQAAQAPNNPWGRSDPGVELSAQLTTDFTADPAQGNNVTVHYTRDLATDSKVDGKPVEHHTGGGTFVFDTDRGLVTTLSGKFVDEVTTKNILVRIPVTLQVDLLSDDQADKLKAAAKELSDRDAQRFGELQKRFAQGGKEIDELPTGVTKTPSMGVLPGGEPFMRIDADNRPVIGFHLSIGEWDGHNMLRDVDAFYEKPSTSPDATKFKNKPGDQIDVLPRDGYAVGGVFLSGPDQARAIRVIFMKKTATGLDPKVAYVSPWYGELIGQTRVRVGGTGKFVAGTFGRKGMNMNEFGLLMFDDKAAAKPTGDGKDPTDDPTFTGAPAPKP